MSTIFELSLHLFLINLDTVFVPLDGSLVLHLHLAGLSLSKFDLLLHQCTILFEVDVFVVEFVLTVVKFLLHIVVALRDFNLFELEFFALFVQDLVFLSNEILLRLNLILKSDLLTLKLCNLACTQLVFLDEFPAFVVVCLHLLIKLHLAMLSGLLQCFSLFY